MQTPREALWHGVRVMAPMLPGAVPFGMTTGIVAVEAGLSPAEALGSSVLIFAGASQMAAVQLMSLDALPLVIVLTAWVINLRFSMYSATLAPHFAPLPARWKWPLSYLLTDQAFAATVLRAGHSGRVDHVEWFYLGGAVLVWLVWQVSTALGVFLGAWVPASWSLGFAVPLIFMGMLVPAVRDRPSALAAVVGGGIAVLAVDLPLNLGLFAGAVAGIASGVLAENWSGGRRP
jgi:4-azaleucine resistance transporter AzlC